MKTLLLATPLLASAPLFAAPTARFAVVPVGGSNIIGTVTNVTGTNGTNTRDLTVNLTSGTGEFKLRVLD